MACFSQRNGSTFALVLIHLFGLEIANGVRTGVHLMSNNDVQDVGASAEDSAKAKKPFWKKVAGITNKYEETEMDKVMKYFGASGTKLAVLFPDEKLDMAYKKGSGDYLVLTQKRLIHIDKEKAKGFKRLAGDSGKVTYTTIPWRHISDFKTTTLGLLETFNQNQETELEVKVSSGEWLRFDFAKKVDILEVNKYFSETLFSAETLVYADLPVLSGTKPFKYTSETTGRLKQISFDALPSAVSKILASTERMLAAFSYKKLFSVENTDYVVITNRRVIDADRQGAAKVELVSHPFSSHLKRAISSISVTTAGGFDLDSEMFVSVYGVGMLEADFTRETDSLALYTQLTNWVLS